MANETDGGGGIVDITVGSAGSTATHPNLAFQTVNPTGRGGRIEVPLGPQEVTVDGIAPRWVEIERDGRKPLLINAGGQLRKLSMTLDVAYATLDPIDRVLVSCPGSRECHKPRRGICTPPAGRASGSNEERAPQRRDVSSTLAMTSMRSLPWPAARAVRSFRRSRVAVTASCRQRGRTGPSAGSGGAWTSIGTAGF